MAEPSDYPPLFERKKVNGTAVVSDEPMPSGLSKLGAFIPIRRIRLLTLEDDTVVHGCALCPFDGTLGEVRQHLTAKHGMSRGGVRAKSPAEAATDDVFADRRLPYPSEVALGRTLWELLDLAEKVDDWEDAFAAQETLIADLRAKTAEANLAKAAAEKELHALQRKVRRALGVDVVAGS